MNGKIFFIVLVIALGVMSCEDSTTAPAEQKFYLFQSTGSNPVPTGGGNPKIDAIEMTKNANGIWQATVIVPASAEPALTSTYYSVLFANDRTIRSGGVVYGDTASNSIKVRILPFPVENETIKQAAVYENAPPLNAIRITPVTRPDTVVFSLDPVNLRFSVQGL